MRIGLEGENRKNNFKGEEKRWSIRRRKRRERWKTNRKRRGKKARKRT
jgi:hypothetical protein